MRKQQQKTKEQNESMKSWGQKLYMVQTKVHGSGRAVTLSEAQLGGHGHALQTKRTRPVSGENSPPWSRAFESLCIAAAACAFAWASFWIAACDQMRGAE